MSKEKKVRVIKGAVELPSVARDMIEQLRGDYITAKNYAESWEMTRKALGKQLEDWLIAVQADTIQYDKYEVIRSNGRSAGKLNEQKLLEKGVDPEVIKECWEEGKEYTYVQVKERKTGEVVAEGFVEGVR